MPAYFEVFLYMWAHLKTLIKNVTFFVKNELKDENNVDQLMLYSYQQETWSAVAVAIND